MDIESHIQLPNGILKYFRDESDSQKKVWYLDIKTGEIKKKASRKLGTKNGFYSPETERFLSANVESAITNLNKKVREFCEGKKEKIQISKKEADILKRYIKCSCIRSDLTFSTFNKNSLTSVFYTSQANHDSIIACGMKENSKLDEFIDSMNINVLKNSTDRNLVIPRNCFYGIYSCGKFCIIAPVSPKAALMLIPQNYPFNLYAENNLLYCGIEEARMIQELNYYALKYEYMFNGDFIASNSEYELKKLQNYMIYNKEMLDALKRE